jgi:hypothetical protein
MKKFSGHKCLDDIIKQCNAQNVPIDIKLYVNGSDYVTVGKCGMGHAIYNTVNGCFWGETNLGVRFDSDDSIYDDQDWMQALLNFFLVEQ